LVFAHGGVKSMKNRTAQAKQAEKPSKSGRRRDFLRPGDADAPVISHPGLIMGA
jgi:hypothetical protein